MKANLSKMLRSMLALCLALCLVLGMVPAAFATEMDVDATIAEIKELAKKAGYSDAEIDLAFEYAQNQGYTEEEIAEKYQEKKDEGMTDDEIIAELEAKRDEIIADAAGNVKAAATAYIKNTLAKIATQITEYPGETYAGLYSILEDRNYLSNAAVALESLEYAVNGAAEKLAAIEAAPAALAAELEAMKAVIAEMKVLLATPELDKVVLLNLFDALKLNVQNIKDMGIKAGSAIITKEVVTVVVLAWEIFLDERVPAALNFLVTCTKDFAAEYKDEIIDRVKTLAALLVANYDKIIEVLPDSVVNELTELASLLASGQERAACAKIVNVVEDILVAVKNLTDTELADKIIHKAWDVMVAVVKAVYNRYIQATHDYYTVSYASSYVALGDASAAPKSYAENIAKELHMHYTNLADVNLNTAGDAFATIEANAATIAAADLITLGFDNNTFAVNALKQDLGINWTASVGETAAKAIAVALNDIEQFMMNDCGVTAEQAAMVSGAVEAYAYSAASYAWNMPKLVKAVRAINPNAVVVLVGMYNPMENITIDLGGVSVEIGGFIDYLVDMVAIQGLSYAMLTLDCIYVNAPAVETEYEAAGEPSVMDAVAMTEFYATEGAAMRASNAGDEYIKTQILNALTINYDGVYRVYGETRFDTAIKVAEEMKYLNNVEKFETMIITDGGEFADALAGTYLATQKNAPILLSYIDEPAGRFNEAGNYYDLQTAKYIAENLAENGTVYILGGEAAVSADMEQLLIDCGVKEENIAERLAGANRHETNLAILNELGVEGKEVLVCTGWVFADTLAASATGLPILLVNNAKTELYDYQVEFLNDLNGNAISILGGNAAVSDELQAAIAEAAGVEVARVVGAGEKTTRIDTAIAVANKYFPNNTQIVLATGWEFADALAGGSMAATLDAPIILTMGPVSAKGYEYSKNWNYGAFINETYTSVKDINMGVVLGGFAEKCIPDVLARASFGLPTAANIVTNPHTK